MIGPMYGKSERKYSDFRIFCFGFSDHAPIIPPNFRWGYDWCHVGGMIYHLGV